MYNVQCVSVEIGFCKMEMAISTDDMMQFCKRLCLIQHAESLQARLAIWLCNSVSAGHGATVNCSCTRQSSAQQWKKPGLCSLRACETSTIMNIIN